MCGKTYWIHSLLQVVTCECATARINGAKPFTIDAWQGFFLFSLFSSIRDYIKEGRVLLLLFPSLSLSLLTGPLKYGVCVCCFVVFVLSGYYVVMLCVKRNKKNVDKKELNYLLLSFTPQPWLIFLLSVRRRNHYFETSPGLQRKASLGAERETRDHTPEWTATELLQELVRHADQHNVSSLY